MSHYLNEMRKELDQAVWQRRESGLETQRLREKCVQLEDKLQSERVKTAALEEKLEKALSRQKYLQNQVDTLTVATASQISHQHLAQHQQQHQQQHLQLNYLDPQGGLMPPPSPLVKVSSRDLTGAASNAMNSGGIASASPGLVLAPSINPMDAGLSPFSSFPSNTVSSGSVVGAAQEGASVRIGQSATQNLSSTVFDTHPPLSLHHTQQQQQRGLRSPIDELFAVASSSSGSVVGSGAVAGVGTGAIGMSAKDHMSTKSHYSISNSTASMSSISDTAPVNKQHQIPVLMSADTPTPGIGSSLGMLSHSVSSSALSAHGQTQLSDSRQQRHSTSERAPGAMAVSDEFESFIASRAVWSETDHDNQLLTGSSNSSKVGRSNSHSHG